jgi:hypothetical protein
MTDARNLFGGAIKTVSRRDLLDASYGSPLFENEIIFTNLQ